MIDTLEQQLHCQIGVSFSHEGSDDLSDLKLTVTGLSVSDDSLGYTAEYIANAYLPYLDYKGKYQSLIVNMESESEGRVSVGSRQVFRFKLEE